MRIPTEDLLLPSEDYRILNAIQRRVLWLCTLMIHQANHVQSNKEGNCTYV